MQRTIAGGRSGFGHSILLIGCMLLFSNDRATAGWFSSDKGDKAREEIHRRLDKVQAPRFLSLVRLRANLAEELVVFKRVQSEKQTELAGYDARFVKIYRIDPDMRYRYDPSSNALFRLEDQVKDGVTNVVQHFDRAFDQELGGTLLKDMVGKSLANQQVRALVLLMREKNQEHALVNETLFKEFGIDPSGKYRYDDVKQVIYMTVDKKDGKQKPGPVSPTRAPGNPERFKPADSPPAVKR